jgi:hypothetical protein
MIFSASAIASMFSQSKVYYGLDSFLHSPIFAAEFLSPHRLNLFSRLILRSDVRVPLQIRLTLIHHTAVGIPGHLTVAAYSLRISTFVSATFSNCYRGPVRCLYTLINCSFEALIHGSTLFLQEILLHCRSVANSVCHSSVSQRSTLTKYVAILHVDSLRTNSLII